MICPIAKTECYKSLCKYWSSNNTSNNSNNITTSAGGLFALEGTDIGLFDIVDPTSAMDKSKLPSGILSLLFLWNISNYINLGQKVLKPQQKTNTDGYCTYNKE